MSTHLRTNSVHDCEAILELIPDYAFGLTSAEETRMVEANLDSCPEAVAQLADFRQMQVVMRADVPQMTPPADLEARLMAVISTPSAPAIEVVSAKPRRTIRWGWITAAAAMVALVLTNVYWLSRANETPVQNEERPGSSPIHVQGDTTFTLTGASDLRWVHLPASQQNTGANAVLLWNTESKIGLLYVRGFPKLSAGKTFQLWLTKGEERVSAGTFRVDEDGGGALLFNINDGIDKYTWARITEEPADGSMQPGDQVVVVGEL